MKIKTTDLLDVIDILRADILEAFPDEIYIDAEDFYWQISEDELYDPTQEPRVEELGQLSDDWSELLRLKREEEIPISYDLNRLATILKIIKKKSVGIW